MATTTSSKRSQTRVPRGKGADVSRERAAPGAGGGRRTGTGAAGTKGRKATKVKAGASGRSRGRIEPGSGARPKAKRKATDAKRGGKTASRIDKSNGKRR
jgi:hypothetical protein